MQDQNQTAQAAQNTAGETVMLPAQLTAHLKHSDMILFLSVTEEGQVVVKPVVPAGSYDIENNQAHLLGAVIVGELPNLLASANGKWTDADRYQALRMFATLGAADKDRFEKINLALQEYESTNKVNLSETTDPATYDAYANFLADALLVTHPEDVAQQPKELVIPGSGLILPLR